MAPDGTPSPGGKQVSREAAVLFDPGPRPGRLEAAGIKAELQVRQSPTITGRELAALGNFRLLVRSREAEIARERAERVKSLAAQVLALLEAQRRCRLLERLRARRLEEWSVAGNKEIEELASETYLAQWMLGGEIAVAARRAKG